VLLPPGTQAPDFRLRTTPDQLVGPTDFLGQPVVLVFYPADWSPVCSEQMVLYQELCDEFQKHDAQVLGISVDGVWCHLAFAKHRNVRIPLLADFEPKGAVSRLYNAYREGDGYSERALFVLDPDGKVFWSYLSPIGVNPGVHGVLSALENLSQQRSS
jgi:peroxiredoxin